MRVGGRGLASRFFLGWNGLSFSIMDLWYYGGMTILGFLAWEMIVYIGLYVHPFFLKGVF